MKQVRLAHALLAISLVSGCGQKHEAVRRCVDEGGNVSDNRNCETPASGSAHHYTWVYAPAGAAKADETGSPSKEVGRGAEGSKAAAPSR